MISYLLCHICDCLFNCAVSWSIKSRTMEKLSVVSVIKKWQDLFVKTETTTIFMSPLLVTNNNNEQLTCWLVAAPIPTSVVDISERWIDELSEVSSLLCDVQQQWDGLVLTSVKVHQGFRQTCLTCRGLWDTNDRLQMN